MTFVYVFLWNNQATGLSSNLSFSFRKFILQVSKAIYYTTSIRHSWRYAQRPVAFCVPKYSQLVPCIIALPLSTYLPRLIMLCASALLDDVGNSVKRDSSWLQQAKGCPSVVLNTQDHLFTWTFIREFYSVAISFLTIYLFVIRSKYSCTSGGGF